MSLINSPEKLPSLQLERDITKYLKRGHRWAFANCFDEKHKLTQKHTFNASDISWSVLP
jgi:hypothetical protein